MLVLLLFYVILFFFVLYSTLVSSILSFFRVFLQITFLFYIISIEVFSYLGGLFHWYLKNLFCIFLKNIFIGNVLYVCNTCRANSFCFIKKLNIFYMNWLSLMRINFYNIEYYYYIKYTYFIYIFKKYILFLNGFYITNILDNFIEVLKDGCKVCNRIVGLFAMNDINCFGYKFLFKKIYPKYTMFYFKKNKFYRYYSTSTVIYNKQFSIHEKVTCIVFLWANTGIFYEFTKALFILETCFKPNSNGFTAYPGIKKVGERKLKKIKIVFSSITREQLEALYNDLYMRLKVYYLSNKKLVLNSSEACLYLQKKYNVNIPININVNRVYSAALIAEWSYILTPRYMNNKLKQDSVRYNLTKKYLVKCTMYAIYVLLHYYYRYSEIYIMSDPLEYNLNAMRLPFQNAFDLLPNGYFYNKGAKLYFQTSIIVPMDFLKVFSIYMVKTDITTGNGLMFNYPFNEPLQRLLQRQYKEHFLLKKIKLNTKKNISYKEAIYSEWEYIFSISKRYMYNKIEKDLVRCFYKLNQLMVFILFELFITLKNYKITDRIDHLYNKIIQSLAFYPNGYFYTSCNKVYLLATSLPWKVLDYFNIYIIKSTLTSVNSLVYLNSINKYANKMFNFIYTTNINNLSFIQEEVYMRLFHKNKPFDIDDESEEDS